MVKALVESIRARGEEAFLHVADTNVNAYRLYLAMGVVAALDLQGNVVGPGDIYATTADLTRGDHSSVTALRTRAR